MQKFLKSSGENEAFRVNSIYMCITHLVLHKVWLSISRFYVLETKEYFINKPFPSTKTTKYASTTNLSLAPTALEQGGIFIVPHRLDTVEAPRFFVASSIIQSPFDYKQGLRRTYSITRIHMSPIRFLIIYSKIFCIFMFSSFVIRSTNVVIDVRVA